MPRPLKRFIQKWIISHRARRPVSVQDAQLKLHAPIHSEYQRVRGQLNNPQSDQAVNRMFGRIRNTNHWFALTRAFRAAGIFGNETRNDLLNVRTWSEVEQKIGQKRAEMMQRTYQQALDAAHEAEKNIFVEGESRARQRMAEPAQRPVHGSVIQGNFGQKSKKRAA